MTDTLMQNIFLSTAYTPINHPLLSQHIHLTDPNSKTKDTDAAFGSSGSFFHWPLISGSYECNPPFEVHRMELEAKKTFVVHDDKAWYEGTNQVGSGDYVHKNFIIILIMNIYYLQ